MDFSYDSITEFFKNYFETFNKYGQSRETIHRMDESDPSSMNRLKRSLSVAMICA